MRTKFPKAMGASVFGSTVIAVGLSFGSTVSFSAPTVGLKNFLQVYEGMLSATGITKPTPELVELFGNVKARLPKTGQIEDMNASMPSALLALSHKICQMFVKNESESESTQRKIFRAIDFTKGPAEVTPAARREVVKSLGDLFLPDPINQAGIDVLTQTLTALETTAPNNGVGTAQLMVEACTVVSSSLAAAIN